MLDLPEVLDPDDVSALIDACDENTWTGRRNRVLLLLMVRCGLRVSEACQLTRDRVELSDPSWLKLQVTKRTVANGKLPKRSRKRNIPVPGRMDRILHEWCLEDYTGTSNGILLPTRRGTALDRTDFAKWLKRHAVVAGLDPRVVHPHRLRHTAITDWLDNGFSLHEAQAMAGHSSIAITGIYLHVRNAETGRKMKEWAV